MKKVPLSAYEQQLLNQRGIIETLIGHLKHHDQNMAYSPSFYIECDDPSYFSFGRLYYPIIENFSH